MLVLDSVPYLVVVGERRSLKPLTFSASTSRLLGHDQDFHLFAYRENKTPTLHLKQQKLVSSLSYDR